jgi:hypothetical protein
MKTDKQRAPRALRSLVTLQTLVRDAKPKERHQIANRFARLENERVRLEHERSIWEVRLKTTDQKLAKVCEEIDVLRPFLSAATGEKPALRAGHGGRHAEGLGEARERSPAQNRTIQLGY